MLAAGWMLSHPLPAGGATITNVSVGDNFFSPASVAITVGDRVRWAWTGGNNHSSTANAGAWDSGIHGTGFTFTNLFNSAGSFPYHCNVHGSQTGTISVQAASNVLPSVSITNPPNNSVLNAPASFTLGATASDSDGSITNVQFLQGAASLGNDTTSPYAASVNSLVAGNYTFSAVASDNRGGRATNTISVIVNALPTVAVTNPAPGTVFGAPASFTLGASASDTDGSITNVQFLRDGASLGNDTTSPYAMNVSSLTAGNYTFSAVASDNRGARATNAISVIVNALPVVAMTNPPPGTVFGAPASFTLGASASDTDGSITNVQFLRDGASLGNDTTSPYAMNVSSLTAGSYTFSAVASDNRGARATNAISVNVVTPGAIILSQPQKISPSSFQFTYSANPGLRYTVLRSTDTANWIALSTNTAAVGSEVFVDTAAPAGGGLYRVRLVPNP